MLIGRPCDGGFFVVDGFSRIVRLGEALAETGALQETAMARTIEALKICAEKIKSRNVRHVRAVATAACRHADNGDAFVKRVLAETGLELTTISADDEAQLTLSGCAPLLDTGHPHGLLFDIGGGSTEITWVETAANQTPRSLNVLSIPLGVVTLAESYGGDLLCANQFEEIIERLDADLAPFSTSNGICSAVADNQVQMIGTSGTMTTLGALHLGLTRYDRSRVDGLSIDMAHVRAQSARFSELDCQTREAMPCIGAGRADLMLMGCAVLAAITRRWPVDAIRVADRGIRDGLIMEMIAGRSSTNDRTTLAHAS